MNKLTKDPLMGSARILLALGMAAMIFAMIALAIGAGAVLTVEHANVLAKIEQAGAPGGAYWAIIATIALLIGLLFLTFLFLRELHRIVASVDQGDPFKPENADRLSKMGWLALAGQVLATIIGAVAAWFMPYLEDENAHFDVEMGFSGGGLLLVLTLFILSRVFRQASDMRADLEGTV